MSEDTTQQLLVARVDRLISLVEESNARLQRVEARMDSLEARMHNVEDGQASHRDQLTSLDAKIEKRLQDTRPIWESVQSQLQDLDSRTTRIETELTEFRAETATGFRGIDRKIGVLSKNLVDMTADIRELQDRVEPHAV
jgi:chromosome segregation ATPase